MNRSLETADPALLRHYLETRKTISVRVGRISAAAHLMGLLRHCGDDTVPVSPAALAEWADLVGSEICLIQESLDDFLFPAEIEAVLEH